MNEVIAAAFIMGGTWWLISSGAYRNIDWSALVV